MAVILILVLANIWVHWIINPFKVYLIRNYKDAPTRMRPFDCEQCMAFWATLIYHLIYSKYWEAALYSGLAYFLAGVVSRYFIKYLNKYYARAIKRFF